jgi:hypothetical protein
MRIATLALVLALTGCAASAAPTAPTLPSLQPTALQVAEPALPLAAQAEWIADPASEADVALALDPATSEQGIAALRKRGQLGLDALLATLGDHAATDPFARDVVAKTALQLDAHASGLFWYTDKEAALARAKAENKPVLSLRLLGRLDEELSCANSRFFRTAVYPNAGVAAYLRQSFVLHWSSERPAPRITIDYGDGRKLERTITGNSLHYVLDASGRVVDALPGLYGARAFVEELEKIRPQAVGAHQLAPVAFAASLGPWHASASNAIRATWRNDLAAFGLLPPAVAVVEPMPNAAEAAPIAMAKMAAEAPMVEAVMPGADLPSAEELEQRTDSATWRQLAIRGLERARLDGVSRALIRSKRPVAQDFERMFLALEMRVSEDTLKNELVLHRRVHDWLAAGMVDFDQLNAKIYAELFLTPASDPWLGLLPADTFTGLPNDGVTTNDIEVGQR